MSKPISLLEYYDNKVATQAERAEQDRDRKRKAARAKRAADAREMDKLARRLDGSAVPAWGVNVGDYVLGVQGFPNVRGKVSRVVDLGNSARIEFSGRSATSDYVGIDRRALVVIQKKREPGQPRSAAPSQQRSQTARRQRRAGSGWTA